MARRRFGAPHAVGTKGHSILKQRSYGVTTKRPATDVYLSSAPRHFDSHAEEDSLYQTVGHELISSAHAVDDSYAMAHKSRDRDHQLMSDINHAIPPSIYEPVKPRAGWRSTPGIIHPNRYHSSSSRLPQEKSAPPPELTSYEWPTSSDTTKYRASAPLTSSLDTGHGTDHGHVPRYKSTYHSPVKSLVPLSSEHSNEPSLIMKTWNQIHSTQPTYPSYLPERTQLLHGYISPKWYSSPRISPYTSGLHTPVRASGYDTPLSLGSEDGLVEYRPRYPRRKPPLGGGGYFERLLNKRSRKLGRRQPRNWPYYDVESIASSDLDDVLSDTGSVEEYDYDYPINRDTLGVNEPLIFDVTPRPEDDYLGDTYYIDNDSLPSTPAEYVPFRPRVRFSPIDSLNGSADYESTLSRLPDLSTVPYIPHTYSSDNKSTVADDIMFNSIVAAAAARTRNALHNVDLSDYDRASLVFSVEGEYNEPDSGVPYGFHYISRPLPIKGPMLEGYGSYSVSASDSAFDKYMNDMQDFRSQIRNRLEEGYRSLREAGRYAPSYALTSGSDYNRDGRYVPRFALTSGSDHSYSNHLPDKVSISHTPVSFRKRLEDGYDDELVLYPLPYPERGLPAIHSSEDLDSESRLSTFEKVKIKAALIGQKVDVVLPERRKPKIYHSAPKPRMHKIEDQDYRGLSSSGLHAHVPGHYPPSQAKAIRDVDGFTDPKNVMSWKYRLEARARPSDLLFHSEHAYESMKDRVLDVQGKLDRHRQLLDRYLTPNLGPETEDVPSQVMNKYTELEARDPMGAGGHYHPISHDSGSHGHHHESHVDVGMTGLPSRQPVSDLRRRLRRVICKSKRDASYYN
ncbi:hypothetical protein ScPMuIL_000932 [Solemya velum]